MDNVIHWYQSKTIWGTVIGLVAIFAPKLVNALGGGDAMANQAVAIADAVAVLIAAGVAIYGRVTAKATVATPSNPIVPPAVTP